MYRFLGSWLAFSAWICGLSGCIAGAEDPAQQNAETAKQSSESETTDWEELTGFWQFASSYNECPDTRRGSVCEHVVRGIDCSDLDSLYGALTMQIGGPIATERAKDNTSRDLPAQPIIPHEARQDAVSQLVRNGYVAMIGEMAAATFLPGVATRVCTDLGVAAEPCNGHLQNLNFKQLAEHLEDDERQAVCDRIRTLHAGCDYLHLNYLDAHCASVLTETVVLARQELEQISMAANNTVWTALSCAAPGVSELEFEVWLEIEGNSCDGLGAR